MGRYAGRIALAVAGLALVATLAVSVALAAGPGTVRVRGANPFAGVNFVSVCGFSHRAMDDPIVHSGQPGASHDHSFVGNLSTDAFSTLESLQGAGSTCQRPADEAGYWLPTLVVDGQPVNPLGATVYYRRNTVSEVHAFPAGLKLIAGDSKATSPQGKRITFWNCGAEGGAPVSDEPPACPSDRGEELRLHVNFPSCWDGTSTDSADHKSHVVYPAKQVCPDDHPVAVPAITIIYRYPVSGDHEFALASGGVYSAHADFFNAWIQRRLTELVNLCLNGLQHCGRGA